MGWSLQRPELRAAKAIKIGSYIKGHVIYLAIILSKYRLLMRHILAVFFQLRVCYDIVERNVIKPEAYSRFFGGLIDTREHSSRIRRM